MKSKLKKVAALTVLAAAMGASWSAHSANLTGKWVTGYYGGYFWDNKMYQAPEHVDMTAMTHFVFARIGPGSAGDIVLGAGSAHTDRDHGPGVPWEKTVEEYLVMRAHQVGTKALIMLGGEGDNDNFRKSCQPDVRPTFVKNLVDYMVAHDYDGIDVDWEGIPDDNASDQALLEALVSDLRKEANARARYQKEPVIITFPGGVLNPNTDKVLDHHKRLAAMVDQYNFMSYGMGWLNQQWKTTTFAPLTPAADRGRPTSIAGTIKMFADAGIPRSKLGMGLGFYGMNYNPPFSQPNEVTDGHPMSDFSYLDYRWSYTLLNKLGYLNKGTYVWERETQTSFRTYPGGYTVPEQADIGRPETVSGYITYEEPATIAAKGAWALSSAPNEGAGGTIIWLVNYGTTDGVNNPLLTATKKAFLDPSAVEPGPYPNPLPPPPPPVIVAEKTITADWGSGYCADLKMTNTGGSAGPWKYVQNPFEDTITSLWNGAYSLVDRKLTIEGPGYSPNLRIGQSITIGMCATRPAKPVETPPPPPPGTVTAKLNITADWGSGYCGSIAVTNNGTTKVSRWTVDVANVAGTISGLWNGKYTMEGTTMHLSPPDWNPDLAAGATNNDAGFCATR